MTLEAIARRLSRILDSPPNTRDTPSGRFYEVFHFEQTGVFLLRTLGPPRRGYQHGSQLQ